MTMTQSRPRPAPASDSASSWIRTHQEPIWRYLRFLRCPEDQAVDVLQDTFVAALSKQPDIVDWASARARAWLRTTARNLWLDVLRQNSRHPELPDTAAVEAFWVAREEDAPSVLWLRECLSQLSAPSREVLMLRYEGELSREQMATTLATPEQTVKKRLQRARASLRQCIQEKERNFHA